jgi:hypothetical protein
MNFKIIASRRIITFTRFIAPVIKQIYPKLIAENLVSVQPMTAPSTLIFYRKYK